MKKSKKEVSKEYYLKNKEQVLKQHKEHYYKNKERLLKQHKEYKLKNKERIKEVSIEWYLKNREHLLEQSKEYYLKTIEKRKECMREYYYKNIEHFKEYNSKLENRERRRNHQKNRYQTDINYRISKICRARLSQALKGVSKSASTMKLIGCTSDELRRHIESKFEPWMTWENQGRGGWDIEHIKACANFNLVDPEQQCACFNWSNLQPMEHIANIKKGVRE